jgi:hypothetical protein
MPRKQTIPRGLCDREGCHNVGELTRYKGMFVCGACLNPPDKLDVTEYLVQPEDANLPEDYGEKYEFGDILEVQVAVGQRRRYYASQHRKRKTDKPAKRNSVRRG